MKMAVCLMKKFWSQTLHRFRINQDKIFMTHLTFHALDIHRFWLCKLLGYRGPVSMGSAGQPIFQRRVLEPINFRDNIIENQVLSQ